MKLSREGNDDARSRRRLDDATAEALIAGDAGAGTDDLATVSAFLHELRALGDGPPPSPSPALARMLAGEPAPRAGSILRLVGEDEGTRANHPAASNGHHRRGDADSKRPSAGVVARAALLALVATAGVTGAAAARLLPEPAQKAVSRAIETVTPFEVPATSGGDGGGGADEAMSRQGEPFDPGDDDRAAARAGDPNERRNDRSGDRPASTERAGDRTRPGPAVGGDRSQQRPNPRPGPAVPGDVTTTPPAPSPSTGPSPAPSPAPAPTGRDGAGSASAPPAGGRTYTATLRGNTDPARPGDPDGSGRASVTVHLGRELLCVAVIASATEPVSSIHLHEASATSTRPIVTAPAPASEGSPACFGVDREVLRKIRRNPAGHYVEVHNAEFPDGALRGFLSP